MFPGPAVIGAGVVARGIASLVGGTTYESTVSGKRYRDNWDLSSSRAAAVASFLQHAHGIDGKMLSAAGFGSTRPLSNNNTPAGREANRRVELAIEFEPAD